ncbi:PREDICTED: probable asparagine--tRNA ligase, mitochondrial [Nicrophorus vespilloides]|uniref:asparagine--tRNA ligase n=1 Tax=Nicrophorus vespilloides TaxID=110193 RepID=A0ABM1MM29_NICVS|nr:PREDICTED: probable asparagine--tRNA ligase, mitochondrial [Nicrophorus vespilloides]
MFKNFKMFRRYYNSSAKSIANVLKNKESGDFISVQGWVKSMRKMKENVFFDVSDGCSEKRLQILLNNSLKPTDLTPGSSIIAKGKLSLSPKGDLELNAEEVKVLGECIVSEGYPFAPKKQYNADYIRQYLHLRSRTNKFSSVLRIRDAATFAVHEHLHEQGYINVHTPILTSNDCEGAGEVFTVFPDNKETLKQMSKPNQSKEEAYFNSKVFLSVSGQLHLEALSHGISKVYTFGPTFRAENSRSRLHLSEFYMLETETAFMSDIKQLTDHIENMVVEMTKKILNKYPEDLKKAQDIEVDLSWVNKKFPILTYEEAVDIAKQRDVSFNSEEGFTKEDEMFIVKHCGNIPTFIIDWPKEKKPFYMKECTHDSTKVDALDLLAPNVGEVVGGSLRENSYEKLKENLPSENLEWYLDLRKFGSVPTGGCGLGFERYLQMILGISSIKDVIPFPRWPHNCNL